MSGNKNTFDDPVAGCFFADPKTLPGEYVPAKRVFMKEAIEYSQKVLEEENRYVSFEEMQQFAIR